MYLEFPIRVGWGCFWSRDSEIHIITTNPFFAAWVALLTARRGSKVVYLVYDLFPDALVVGGRLRERALAAKLLRRLVRRIFDRAAASVFLGDVLRRHAESAFGPVARNCIIPVGTDAAPFAKHAPKPPPAGAAVELMYCGNLGNLHDTDTVVAAVRLMDAREQAPGVALTFHASGPAYPSFRSQIMAMSARVASWVRLDGPLTDQIWVARMLRAHVALVTMKRGAEAVVMPSKAYSALAAGQAILAVCPVDSDLAEIVRRYDCGWVVGPGDADGLVRALDEISANPGVVQRKRENAFRAGQGDYSEAAVGASWRRLLDTLATSSPDSAVRTA